MDADRGGWSDTEPHDDRRDPVRRAGRPAVGLILVAILGFVGNCGALAVLNQMRQNQPRDPPPPNVDQEAFKRGQAAAPLLDACLLGVPTITVYGLVLAGGIVMQRLRARGLAITASILAMLPCGPAFLVGLPVGIWALVVLSSPDVADAFAGRNRRRRGRNEW